MYESGYSPPKPDFWDPDIAQEMEEEQREKEAKKQAESEAQTESENDGAGGGAGDESGHALGQAGGGGGGGALSPQPLLSPTDTQPPLLPAPQTDTDDIGPGGESYALPPSVPQAELASFGKGGAGGDGKGPAGSSGRRL